MTTGPHTNPAEQAAPLDLLEQVATHPAPGTARAVLDRCEAAAPGRGQHYVALPLRAAPAPVPVMASITTRPAARRRARRARAARSDLARAAYQARAEAWLTAHPDTDDPLVLLAPVRYRRWEVRAVTADLPAGPSRKQRAKHQERRHARWEERHAQRRARQERVLAAALTGTGFDLVELAFLGSHLPMTAHGTVTHEDGPELAFAFTLRHDHATMVVGEPDPTWPELVGAAHWVARRENVTGQAHTGWLPERQAVALLADLIATATPTTPADNASALAG